MDSNFQVKITADIAGLQKSLSSVDGAMNNFKKSVDGVSTATKNMEQNANRGRMVAFAFGQVIRDAGFFSQSFGLGILAISNNIPILIDQISLSVKALAPFAGAISLVGSLLTAGLTVWAYSAMAVKKNKDSIDEYISSLDDLREAQLKGQVNADSEIRALNLLRRAAQDETLQRKERLKAVKELQDRFPDYYGNLSAETIMTGKDADANQRLAASIRAVAEAKASEELIKENRKVELTDNQKLIELQAERIKQKDIIAKSKEDVGSLDAALKRLEATNKLRETEKQIYEIAKERNKARSNTKNLEQGILDLLNKQKEVNVITGGYGEANDAASDLDQKLKDILIKLNSQTRDNLFNYITSDAEAAEGRINSLLGLVDAFQKKLDSASTTSSIDDQITEGPIIPVTPAVPFDIFTAKTKYEEAKKAVEDLNNSVKSVVQTVGTDLVNAFSTMLETGTLSFSGIVKALMGMIKKLIAAALAAAVLSMLLSSIFPGTKNTGFKDIFKMLSGLNLDNSKPMAAGGIVSGPTRALVGEYPGARSNPEVVAPLDKLKNIIGSVSGGNNSGFVASTSISGNDLAIIINRANKK